MTATDRARVERALECALTYANNDSADHQQWVIDQMVRHLTGCELEPREALDSFNETYHYNALGESDEYRQFVAEHNDGEDGPDTYSWDEGVVP